MRPHDFEKNGKRPCRHSEAAFSTRGSKGIGILLPSSSFLGKFLFDLASGHLFPVTMVDFTQTIAPNDLQSMRSSNDRCCLHRSAKRGCKDGAHLLVLKTFRQTASLFSSFV